jgi:hypothetical protein
MGMVSDGMARLPDLVIGIRKSIDIFTDAKKTGLCLIVIQLLQNEFGDLGVRPIVESQIEPFLLGGDAPDTFGIKPG